MSPKIAGEANGGDALFDDLADRSRRKTRADRAVPVDTAKQAALGERGCGKPGSERAHGALNELGGERNGNRFSFATA